MRRPFLFDLDGTLLENSMDTFLPPYFVALTKKLEGLVEPALLIEQLKLSTRAMVANDDPTRTNAQVFAQDFFPKIGVPREKLMPLLDDFYAKEYCDLRVFTQPAPGAHDVISLVFERKHPVVIATAPLFPLKALAQRLEWANLHDFPYEFITDYETMHSSKPNPSYYREVATRLNCPPERCIMVGNDLQMDIMPARHAGMQTFWVTDAGQMPTDVPTDWRGTLGDFKIMLEGGVFAEEA